MMTFEFLKIDGKKSVLLDPRLCIASARLVKFI